MSFRDLDLVAALPLVADMRLVSTAFICGNHDGYAYVATTLHQLGLAKSFGLCLPPHGGNISARQIYPIPSVPVVPLTLVTCDPAVDLAILRSTEKQEQDVIPPALPTGLSVGVAEEVFVIGYPFCGLGSFLQTVAVTHISAIGCRAIGGVPLVNEYVLQLHSHPGISGSPVIRKEDGSLIGVVRGCLSPPAAMSIGDLPLGTDTSVTYCIAAEHLRTLFEFARNLPL